MGTEIIVALITTAGSIIVALITNSSATNSHSKPASPRAGTMQSAGTVFLIEWVCACTVGWTMGWLISDLLSKFSPIIVRNVVSGLVVGVTQWYVLKNKLRESSWWILATASSGVGGSILSVIGSTNPNFGTILVAYIVAGLFAGVTQWLILRRQVYGSDYWVVITVVAWVIGGTVGTSFFQSTGSSAIGGLVCGIIRGLITGGQLVLLLDRPR